MAKHHPQARSTVVGGVNKHRGGRGSVAKSCLGALAADAAGELDVLGHDGA